MANAIRSADTKLKCVDTANQRVRIGGVIGDDNFSGLWCLALWRHRVPFHCSERITEAAAAATISSYPAGPTLPSARHRRRRFDSRNGMLRPVHPTWQIFKNADVGRGVVLGHHRCEESVAP